MVGVGASGAEETGRGSRRKEKKGGICMRKEDGGKGRRMVEKEGGGRIMSEGYVYKVNVCCVSRRRRVENGGDVWSGFRVERV